MLESRAVIVRFFLFDIYKEICIRRYKLKLKKMYRIIQTLINTTDGLISDLNLVETHDIESYRQELLTDPDVQSVRFTYEEIV